MFYELQNSAAAILVRVKASSNLDGVGRKETRRGSTIETLDGLYVQYHDSAPVVGDERIEWFIPVANGSQRGILQSAANGYYGDELILLSPDYGSIDVAPEPGRDGYEEERLEQFGFRVTMRFRRLA